MGRWNRELGRQNKMYYSHGDTRARGVATVIPKSLVQNVVEEKAYGDGRFLVLRIKTDHGIVCLLNVYAPTQDLVREQLEFVQKTQEIIQ